MYSAQTYQLCQPINALLVYNVIKIAVGYRTIFHYFGRQKFLPFCQTRMYTFIICLCIQWSRFVFSIDYFHTIKNLHLFSSYKVYKNVHKRMSPEGKKKPVNQPLKT